MSLNAEYLNDKKYTYDYFYQGDVCRLCWETANNGRSIENETVLARIITELIGVSIKGHVLQTVCYSCADKIESFSNFKKFCLDADEKLKVILASGQLANNVKFEPKLGDPSLLNKEADLELKLLEIQVKKEIKAENFLENDLNYDFDDFQFSEGDEDEFLPVKDDYCYMCKIRFKTIDEKLDHDVTTHKMIQKISYKCYYCCKLFKKFSQKICHETECKVPKTETKQIRRSKRSRSKVIKYEDNESFHEDNESFNHHDESFDQLEEDDEFLTKSSSKTQKAKKKKNPMQSITQKMIEYQKMLNTKNPQRRDKSLKCHTCKITFENRKELQKHKYKHYFTAECICEVCGRVCKRSAMQDHMRIHNNFKELKCPHCDYRATVKRSMDLHVRRKHTTERPYACEVCPYRSATSSNLAAHRRTHTGDRNYVCQLCNKAYSYKAMLNDHIINFHEGKKRFHCNLCPIQYYNFEGLKKHLLVKHGKKVKKDGDGYVEISPEGGKMVNEINMGAGAVL